MYHYKFLAFPIVMRVAGWVGGLVASTISTFIWIIGIPLYL